MYSKMPFADFLMKQEEVVYVWPNWPNDEGCYLSVETELDDGGTYVRIDWHYETDSYELEVSRWVFGDCWYKYRAFVPSPLVGWQKAYEFLNGGKVDMSVDLPEWVYTDGLDEYYEF